MKTRKRTIQEMTLHGAVTMEDISNGECMLQSRCMYKVSVTRALLALEGTKKGSGLGPHTHHVRVDGRSIRFNFRGYRWQVMTPRNMARNIAKYDYWGKRKDELGRRAGAPCPVKPHEWKIRATRTTKIASVSKQRQDQINAARRERVASGLPDKQYKGRTLRERIVGLHLGHL